MLQLIHIYDCFDVYFFQLVILGCIITTHVQNSHRCRCVCSVIIQYRWNVANTIICVLSIHSVLASNIVSKWMGEGEKKLKKVSNFFNMLVMKLHPLFLLMKLIPYVAHEVMTMRMKPLDESKQNFLYKCR